jgi:hypothetical protein
VCVCVSLNIYNTQTLKNKKPIYIYIYIYLKASSNCATSWVLIVRDAMEFLQSVYSIFSKDSYIPDKKDKLYKIQSYNYKPITFLIFDSDILNRQRDALVKNLACSPNPYCISMQLNCLYKHHIVVDIDLKHCTTVTYNDVERLFTEVYDFLQGTTTSATSFPAEVFMFVKYTSQEWNRRQPEYETVNDIYERGRQGIHIEIPDIILTRGDNVVFLYALKDYIHRMFGHDIVDITANWSFPLSQKIDTTQRYYPVFELMKRQILSKFNTDEIIDRFLIVGESNEKRKHLKFDHFYYLPIIEGVGGGRTEFNINIKIGTNLHKSIIYHKQISLVEYQKNISNRNLDYYSKTTIYMANKKGCGIPFLPHIIYRFKYNEMYNFEFDLDSNIEHRLRPFSFDDILKELSSSEVSKESFNLLVFLLLLLEETGQIGFDIQTDILYTLGAAPEAARIVKAVQLFTPTIVGIKKSLGQSEQSRFVPIIFLKCYLTQNGRSGGLFFIEDEGNRFTFSNLATTMFYEGKLTIYDLAAYICPSYCLINPSREVRYYEKGIWYTTENQHEHMFLFTELADMYNKYLRRYNESETSSLSASLPVDGGEEGPPPSKRPKQTVDKVTPESLFRYVTKKWARIILIPFPRDVVAFDDGLLFVNANLFLAHTPIFKGPRSLISWTSLCDKIDHISDTDSCKHERLIRKLVEIKKSTITTTDYMRFNYKIKTDIVRISREEIAEGCCLEAECPVIVTLKYLCDIFTGDLELIFFMLGVIKLAFKGVPLRKVFIYYGTGSNGKSAFSNVLQKVFGTYYTVLSSDTLSKQISQIAPDIVNSRNSKIIYADDIKHINGQTLKQIVSGTEFYVRSLYEKGGPIVIPGLLTASSNFLSHGLDFASILRLLIIPFTKTFSDNSLYYCNDDMFKSLAIDMLTTVVWMGKYDEDLDILCSGNRLCLPQSVKNITHSSIWDIDYTDNIREALGLSEVYGKFILLKDLKHMISKRYAESDAARFRQQFENPEIALKQMQLKYDEILCEVRESFDKIEIHPALKGICDVRMEDLYSKTIRICQSNVAASEREVNMENTEQRDSSSVFSENNYSKNTTTTTTTTTKNAVVVGPLQQQYMPVSERDSSYSSKVHSESTNVSPVQQQYMPVSERDSSSSKMYSENTNVTVSKSVLSLGLLPEYESFDSWAVLPADPPLSQQPECELSNTMSGLSISDSESSSKSDGRPVPERGLMSAIYSLSIMGPPQPVSECDLNNVLSELSISDSSSKSDDSSSINFVAHRPTEYQTDMDGIVELQPQPGEMLTRKKTSGEADLVAKKSLKHGCGEKCRLKCTSKISHEQRQFILDRFWEICDPTQQRNFISNHLKVNEPKYRYQRGGCSNRGNNFCYYLDVGSVETRVCKTFFLNTLDISNTFVSTAISKKYGESYVD